MENPIMNRGGGKRNLAPPQQKEVMDTHNPLASSWGDNTGILEDLRKHINSFIALKEFCETYLPMPSFMFEKNALDWVLDVITNTSTLYSEAQSFVYLIHTYEILKYNRNTDDIVTRFLKSIDQTLSSGVKNDLLYAQKEKSSLTLTATDSIKVTDITEVLNENRVLLGLFIYSLVSMIDRVSEDGAE